MSERVDRLLVRALRSIARGEHDEADIHIGEALALHPGASGAYRIRAFNAQSRGRWADAAEAYEQVAQVLASGQDVVIPAGAGRDKAIAEARTEARNARRRANAVR